MGTAAMPLPLPVLLPARGSIAAAAATAATAAAGGGGGGSDNTAIPEAASRNTATPTGMGSGTSTDTDVINARFCVGMLYHKLQQYELAEAHLAQCLEERVDALGYEHGASTVRAWAGGQVLWVHSLCACACACLMIDD